MEHEDWGLRAAPCDTVAVDACPHVCVKPRGLSITKTEP